jgi:hypothetical protein
MAIGLAAYLTALAVSLPARFVMAWGSRWQLAGTVWNGEGVLDGAYRLTWRVAPLRSLAAFAFAADVRMTGTGTDLAASAIRAPGRLRLDGLSGRGDGALLTALDPTLPFTCDFSVDVNMPRLILDGERSSAVGEVRTGSGSCSAPASTASSIVPPLIAAIRSGPAGTTVAELAPAGQGRLHLATGTIDKGHLTIALTPVGEAALPFLRGFRVDRGL